MLKKSFWIYGVSMGVFLLLLQIMHYRTMIRDIKIEIFGFTIALIFLMVGVWAGLHTYRYSQKYTHPIILNNPVNLSRRELDVLTLMADGYSNQEIADALFVSLNTTKTHISNIYQKLHVKRRTQAIQKAMELRMLDLSAHSLKV